jgi:hypothetical protein
MILTIGEAKDRSHEKQRQQPKETAELVSLPDDIEDYPQEDQG